MPKLVGINHIALEVGDLGEALEFWESIFGPLELRGRSVRSLSAELAQLGAMVEVLGPPEVRQHLGRIGADLSALYGAPSATHEGTGDHSVRCRRW